MIGTHIYSPLADNKDDASDLPAAISGPISKETRSLITDERINSVVPVEEILIQGAFFGGSVTNGNNRQEVQTYFYCNQPGHFARSCPFRGNPTATVGAPHIQDTGKAQ